MYHRLLKILIVSQDQQLSALLQAIAPLEQFSHQVICQTNIDETELGGYAVIILDACTDDAESITKIHAGKDEKAALIACFTRDTLPVLAEVHDLLDQVWVKPFIKEKIVSSFSRLQARIQEREDALLTEKYLDTLIDHLPDLIWFKDARGSHLKVNTAFCQTVEKTKEQVQGRGHYYIWGLEPDEYAQGEYICLESEEIVLNKKETCLFDESVKCHGEMRKFKTYKSPIFDVDGKVIGTVGCARDVTDLQNLLIEMNILLESLPFAAVVTDRERNITSVNRKYTDLFLLQRNDLVGKNLDSFMDETKRHTKNGKWVFEREEERVLMFSEDKVLKIHDEELLDVFGAMAGHLYLISDITLEHGYQNKLLIDANTDFLTKLNNRRSLQDFMRKTPCQRSTVLLLADLDNFKEVNDQFGHDEGDKILVDFSLLLQEMFPAESLFRLGGDEFAIIFENVEQPETAEMYARQLLNEFDAKISRQFSHTKISVSIGIAMDVSDSKNFGDLFKKADMALYESKNKGKSAYTFWNKDI